MLAGRDRGGDRRLARGRDLRVEVDRRLRVGERRSEIG
jgi:hypothetical protein